MALRGPLLALLTCLLAACSTGAPPPAAPPQAGEPDPDPAVPAVAPRTPVLEPTGLADYVPASLAGAPAALQGVPTAERARATYALDPTRVTLDLATIDDVRQTRDSFELLGKDVVARMHGQELRGLRVQGNPAQLARDLEPPHTATLTVVAANTFLVTLTVSPATELDAPLAYAEGVDIGGLTRLAILRHRQDTDTPPRP